MFDLLDDRPSNVNAFGLQCRSGVRTFKEVKPSAKVHDINCFLFEKITQMWEKLQAWEAAQLDAGRRAAGGCALQKLGKYWHGERQMHVPSPSYIVLRKVYHFDTYFQAVQLFHPAKRDTAEVDVESYRHLLFTDA